MKKIELRESHQSSSSYEYYVTQDGKVYRVTKYNGYTKEMFYHIAHGYRRVRILDTTTTTRRYYRVSRLVAEAYIPNPNGFEIVNHKDGNKQNDNVDNLEWCTTSMNTQHAYDNDLIKDRGGWKSTPYYMRQANTEVNL